MRIWATIAAVSVAVCGLAGCTTGSEPVALEQAPVESQVFEGDYQQLASCSYERLDKSSGTGIKKIDLPTKATSRLALESGGVRYWELVFVGIGRNQTKVDFTVVQTVWGPDRLSTGGIMPEVRRCARS
jgi:hypothetical protein